MTDPILRIQAPGNLATFTIAEGEVTVDVKFRGELTAPVTGLYFRWYSSLNPNAALNHYSLNDEASESVEDEFICPLSEGDHVITFVATDQPGQTQADLLAVRRGLVAGGPDDCLIHVRQALS